MSNKKTIIMEKVEIVKVSIDQKNWEEIIIAKVNGKEVKLQPFNINDNRQRKVVCISGDGRTTRGNIYNLTHVNVGSFTTYLTLKEDDGRAGFHNSVNFAETPDYIMS